MSWEEDFIESQRQQDDDRYWENMISFEREDEDGDD